MKITFFSSVLGYHQEGLCKAFYNILGENFKFVAYSKLPEMRRELGFEDLNDKYPFVVKAYEDDGIDKANELIKSSDIAIIGAAPNFIISECIKNNIKTFLFSERFLKKGTWRRFYPGTYKKIYDRTIKFNNKGLNILCASAYLPYDMKICGFKGEMYKWGYFPEVKIYNEKYLKNCKSSNEDVPILLWAGRFLKWKHPEKAIQVAERLKKDGILFKLIMIGTGELYTEIEKMISDKSLENEVELLGVMPPDKVRVFMEKADIHLFTSDYNEGWGVVLNESMNSGCAVVASHAIGSVPYIINNYENGLIYDNNDFDSLYTLTKYLLENKSEMKKLGMNAYKTIIENYSPENAAERFIQMVSSNKTKFEYGVCSIAVPVKEKDMYDNLRRGNK